MPSPAPLSRFKWLELRASAGVAWALHFTVAMLATSAVTAATGCVFPAPLDLEDPDAGPGSPPVITASGPAPEFAFPGPLVIDRNDNPLLSLTLVDIDIDEELYVRLYVDYGVNGIQRPNRSSCVVPAANSVTRVGECAITPVCGDVAVDDEDLHVLEAMVADRRFLEETDLPPGQPPYRGLPSDASWSIRAWPFRCLPAVQ